MSSTRRRRALRIVLAASIALAGPLPALAEDAVAPGPATGAAEDGEPRPVPDAPADGSGAPPDDDVETITVVGPNPESATASFSVPAQDFELRILESGGQMIEAVPNALTAQHTGGGKAEQYFLRGFDADHGTDLLVYFDGVPINLRSHAHGQGYIDLHFVTKETIERLDGYKGPYYARFGDFDTAATVSFVPYEDLPRSIAKFEGGEYDTLRWVGVLSPRVGPFAGSDPPAHGFFSFEAYHTDGPFESDEDLWRFSFLGRGSYELRPGLELSGHALGYFADWNASGLIPERQVHAGLLDRFGSIDPTEGGTTHRAQGKLQLDWDVGSAGHLMANAYFADYALELFSNFTYALEFPVLGDGIVQTDDRFYTGGRVEYDHLFDAVVQTRLRGGFEGRFDDADVALGHQTRRWIRDLSNDDHVKQYSLAPYFELEVTPLEWLRLLAGLRFEYFHFDVRNRLTGGPTRTARDTAWLPKATLTLQPFGPGGPWESETSVLRDLELFVNFGRGFHSNDARAVVEDPGVSPLPLATGAEVGLRTRVGDRVDVAVDYWWLGLDSELVFVGDEGTTEPGPATTRQGVEFATKVWLLDWLYLRGDVAYTSAITDDTDAPIPQAPRFVAKGAIGVRYAGFEAELGVRHLGDRYASDAFYEPKLHGYTVLDLGMSYAWRFLEVGVALENLTNVDWRSSEFFYGSCVPGEVCPPGGVEDFHFTPGNPFNVRGWITARF